MSNTQNQLSVRLHGQPTGILEQQQGKMSFTYLPDMSTTLSLSMQDKNKLYSHDICEAYFDGLLPEGDLARKAIGNQLGINPHNILVC